MKRSAKADSENAPSDAASDKPSKRGIAKHSREKGPHSKKLASSRNVVKRAATKSRQEGSGIRETEEARALLEDQLHSLYWWVFNACKMKGFIRAKGLDELHRPTAAGDEPHTEQGDLADDVSRETQTF
jgi:hypothetical protein